MLKKSLKTYKVTLELRSSLGSPLHADTIFGHLCWGIRYCESEDTLKEFLKAYKDGSPPLIISDGIPEGYFPNPSLHLHKPGVQYSAEEFQRLKDFRKTEWIPEKLFNESRSDLSEQTLFNKWKELKNEELFEVRVILRNTINRLSNTSDELFSTEEFFYKPEMKFSIYVRSNDSRDKIEQRFKFFEFYGYGADKSSGRGNVKIVKVEEYNFPGVENPNAFMSLSCFVPKKDDPTEGWYRLRTKYGKLGGHYAKSRINSEYGHMPFKKPVLMCCAGSIFKATEIKEYYGRLVENVHHYGEIKHYGLAYSLEVRINDNI